MEQVDGEIKNKLKKSEEKFGAYIIFVVPLRDAFFAANS
jgi:hypothetical protein